MNPNLKTIETNKHSLSHTLSQQNNDYQQLSSHQHKTPSDLKYHNIAQLHNLHHIHLAQSLEQLSNTILKIKKQQIDKKIKQYRQEDKEQVICNLKDIDDYICGEVRKVGKEDRTKQWIKEMESTVKQIMVDSKGMYQRDHGKVEKLILGIQKRYGFIYCRAQGLREIQRQESKDREKQWEELIDQVGEYVLELDNLLEDDRIESEQKLLKMQNQMVIMEDETSRAIMGQRKKRQEEHAYLMKLIENVMDRLII